MSKNVKKNYHFLHMLARSSPRQRKALLQSADNSQITSVCEICLNILAGNVPANLKKLKKYKTVIRKLGNRSQNVQAKRRLLLNQSGGAFLPLIAPAIISALSGLFGKVVAKKIGV